MAKKKTQSELDLEQLVEDLTKDVNEDRDVLVNFLKDMISNYDKDQYVGIAEYVAKLADALTRQNQVRVSTLKTIAKGASVDESKPDMDEIHEQVGLPFEDEEFDGGSN